MLVYMLFNTLTEKAYIGQTIKTLDVRWQQHCIDSRSGSNMTVHRALRATDPEFWEPVILCHCSNQKELNSQEAFWIDYCLTTDPEVGYNERAGRKNVRVRGKKKTKVKTPHEEKQSIYTEEQREWLRATGRGEKPTTPFPKLSEDQKLRFKEWGNLAVDSEEKIKKSREHGKRGAEKSRKKLSDSLTNEDITD